MLALKIALLTGRYVAAYYNDRTRPEWPPHPARIFSALVATLHERDSVDPSERAALEWLQTQTPPAIAVSESSERDVREHFVWPNDDSVLGVDAEALHEAGRRVQEAQAALDAAALGQPRTALRELEKALRAARQTQQTVARRLADGGSSAIQAALRVVRLSATGRQARTFPSVTPQEPIVHFIWPTAEPQPPIRAGLASLVARLTRVGHSSSLVAGMLTDTGPPADWVPDDHGDLLLRVPNSGQLAPLEAAYERHHGVEPRILPYRPQRYARRVTPELARLSASTFGEAWIVYKRVSGPPLPVTRTAEATRALRGALMKHAEEQPPPEVLAGHAPDGTRSERPHLALVALPFVGHPKAEGTLLGVAVVLPRELSDVERRATYRALARWEKE